MRGTAERGEHASTCSLRAGARRIEHHRLEAVELLRVERPPEEIAMVDEDLALGAVGGRLERQRGVARGLGREDLAVQRQREGAEPGEQVGDRRRLSQQLQLSGPGAPRRARPLCRGGPDAARGAAQRDDHRPGLPGRAERYGAVAEGKVADILLLDADPLGEHRRDARIHTVGARRDRLLDRAALDRPPRATARRRRRAYRSSETQRRE